MTKIDLDPEYKLYYKPENHSSATIKRKSRKMKFSNLVIILILHYVFDMLGVLILLKFKALEWLNKNRLLVNNDKSTCIILGTRQRISNLILNRIHIWNFSYSM